MRRVSQLACICIILLVIMGGCFRTLSHTNIYVQVHETGSAANVDFPGAIVELSRDGVICQTLSLKQGETACSFSCSPGNYTVRAQSEGRIASSQVETSSGSKTLILNFDTVVIYGEVVMDSARLPRSFGSVRLDLLQNDQIVDSIVLNEDYSYHFCVSPGTFKLRAIFGPQTVLLSLDTAQSRLLSIDLCRTCRIAGIVLERGSLPGPDWPGGYLQVESLDGHIIDEAPINAGQNKFDFMVKPGLYVIKAYSCGRNCASDTIDLSVDDSGAFQIDFQDVVLFGDLLNPSETPPLEMLARQNGSIVSRLNLNLGATKYSLVLPPGSYDIEVSIPQWGGLSRYYTSLDRSRRMDLDPLRKVSISGQVTENGLMPIPGAFPETGQIRIRSRDGVLREKTGIDADGSFHAEILAGEYTIEAVSEGRVASTFRDASRSNQSATINYEDIVVQGTLAWREGGVIPSFPETVVELSMSGLEVKKITIPRGSHTFAAVVPAGEYSVRLTIAGTNITAVKSLGGPIKRSTRSTLDISNDVFQLTGKITANGNAPNGPITVKLTDQFGALQVVEADSAGQYEIFTRKGSANIHLTCPSYLPATYSVYVGGDVRRDLAFTHCNIACTLTLKASLLDTDCRIAATLNDYLKQDTPLSDMLFTGATYIPPFGQRLYTFNVVAPIGETVYFQVWGVDVGAFVNWTLTPEQNCSETRTIPVVLGG